MDGPHRLTRRQALRLGAGAAALGALRVPTPAFAASGPALFELAHRRRAAPTPRATAGARPRCCARRGRFDLARPALGARRELPGPGARPRRRRPLDALDAAARQPRAATLAAPTPSSPAPPTSCSCACAATPAACTARFVRALPHAPRAASPRRAGRRAPSIVPRAGWGADQVPPRSGPSYGSVQAAFVHHTVTAVDYAPEESAGIVLGIARYHRDSNGWNDIGYNFLVDRYGVIFEGRAGGIEAAVIGAQAQGWNSYSTGIACLGTFTNLPLDAPAMESLARLIGWKLSLHGVPVQGQVTLISGGGASNRYPSGTPVAFERVSGHRDGCQTSCPGEQLYAQLPDLRARARPLLAPGLGDHGQAPPARRAPSRSPSPACCASPTAPRPRAPRSASSTSRRARPGRRSTTTTCGPDGAWATSVAAPRQRPGARGLRRRRAPAARLESAPIAVKVVPEHDAHERQAPRARPARAFAISGTLAPVAARRSSACSSGRSARAG